MIMIMMMMMMIIIIIILIINHHHHNINILNQGKPVHKCCYQRVPLKTKNYKLGYLGFNSIN